MLTLGLTYNTQHHQVYGLLYTRQLTPQESNKYQDRWPPYKSNQVARWEAWPGGRRFLLQVSASPDGNHAIMKALKSKTLVSA